MFCWPEQQEVEERDAKGTSRQSDDDRIEQGSVMEIQVWFFLHLEGDVLFMLKGYS